MVKFKKFPDQRDSDDRKISNPPHCLKYTPSPEWIPLSKTNFKDGALPPESLLSGGQQEGAADESNGRLAGIATVNPDYSTCRGIGVGMSEDQLQAAYPELSEQPRPGEIQGLPLGGATAYDAYYVYAPAAGYRNQTKTVLFGVRDGLVVVIAIEDGLDGRLY